MGKVEDFDDEEVCLTIPEMIFTDRDKPRRIFWNIYDRMGQGEFYVINYHGFGGIGKSRLCTYLNDCLRAGKHPETGNEIHSKSLILNFESLKLDCDKVTVLENLANKLENECGYKFPLFKYGLYVYYRTKGHANDSPEINKLQDNTIAATAIDIFGLVPVVGGIGSVVLKGIDSFAASMREKVIKNSEIIKKLDNMSDEDISEEIIRFFIKELREQTQKETAPLVIFLDTYEQLQNYIYQTASAKVSEEWLWSRVGVIRRIPNIIWVMAGQRKLDWGETDSFWRDENNICYEEIGEIKEADRIREMLKELGIKEQDILDTIIGRTAGVPNHLAACKDRYFQLKGVGIKPEVADFDMDYTQLAKRVIGGLNSQCKDIVYILACLETWTDDDIVEMNFSTDDYEYVIGLSFFKRDGNRYHMHKSVQEIVYKTCSPIIRKKCLAYFEKQVADALTTSAEKKDYVFKKLKLQYALLDNMSAEEKASGFKAFAKEVLEYIEEYLTDYNLFVKLYSMLRNDELLPYIDELSGKKLDIYHVYHSTRSGEYAVVRNYINSGKIYDNTGLDDKTKGLLFVSLGKHEVTNKSFGTARVHLLEAYKMLEHAGDLYIVLDVLSELNNVCLKSEKYLEANDVCDMALDLIAKERMNSQLIQSKCNFLIYKTRSYRYQNRMGDAYSWIEQAEKILTENESFWDLESEIYMRKKILVDSEYFYYYRDKGNREKADEYAKLILQYCQKAYELNSSHTNYRNLAISYQDMAKRTKDKKLQEEYFDKSIAITREMYEECPMPARLDDMFSFIRIAMEYTEGECCTKYLNSCEEILTNEKRCQVLWKEQYLYRRALLLYYKNCDDWDKVEQKMTELEQMLEAHRERLSESKYKEYLRWNYRQRGHLSYVKNLGYETIVTWHRLYKMEKAGYEKNTTPQTRRQFAQACMLLAHAYLDHGMPEWAVVYWEEGMMIQKDILDELLTLSTLETFSNFVNNLKDIYINNRQHHKALENYNQLLFYVQKLFDAHRQEECLCTMAEVLVEKGKLLIRQGQLQQVLADYLSFLELVAKQDYLSENENVKNELASKVILVQDLTASLLYKLGQDLERARSYLLASKGKQEGITEKDRQHLLEKIESRIITGQVERVYMTQEEGRAYLLQPDEKE